MASPQYTARDLYSAARDRSWEEVQRIIGAKPQLVNERYFGVTSLMWIVGHEAPQNLVIQSLQFAERASVDDDDSWLRSRRSILHYLSRYGYVEALRRALQISTTRVNWQTTFGNTPLHWLLRTAHAFLVHHAAAQALIDAGADSGLKNKDGLTPVDMYKQNDCELYGASRRKNQNIHIVQLLQRKIIPAEILARGAEALKAFNEALEEGEVEVNQGRNVFLGLERVGKTSTINSFLRKDFNPHEDVTDAIATTKVCTQVSHDELKWRETALDNPGVADIYEEKLADSMAKHLLEKESEKEGEGESTTEPDGLPPGIDETEKTVEKKQGQLSYVDAKSHVTEPESIGRRENPPSMAEVPGNIASKVEERINEIKFTSEATSGGRKYGNDFIMHIWDFGGQPVYHVIQRIFLVSFAVVCVVFNLKDDLDAPANVRDPTTDKLYQHRMTNLQFILYWICSVFTNSKHLKLDDGQLSPPVLLIGTHLHSLEGNEEERKNKAEEIFSQIRQALEGKPYEAMVFPTIFAIENSLPFSMSNASNIMNQILKFAKKMVRILPLKWLLVQQEIQKLKEKHIYLPTTEVIALVDRCGVQHEAQRVLLEYLHDIGEILYFPDDEALKDIIVLDLMRIVDMFRTIITVIDPKLQEPFLKVAWRKLDSGILEERLLRHLWKKFHVSDETFDFFVSLMQKFGLVCEKKRTESDGRLFYVLSRLKPERADSSPTEEYGKRAVSIFHDFGGYLPDDLFQRGSTKFIERFQVENCEPKLSYEHVELDIEEHHHVILDVANLKHRRMFQTTIIRRKILNTNAEDAEPLPSVCKEVLSFLEAELKIFCQSGGRGVELRMYISCVCSPNIRNAHMHIVRKFDKDVLPCGSNGMEVTRYRRLFGDSSQQQALLLSQSAVTKPEGFVDDAIIATVSEEMNLSWRRFGVRLGLTWSKVNTILADEQLKEKAIASMMTHWRNSIGSERHQLNVLCTVLRQHRLHSLAGKLTQGTDTQSDLGDETLNITIHKECFGDQDLLFICGHMTRGWRRLGVRLGLDWNKINEIAHNNRLMEDSIMEVLVTWRDGQPTNQVPTMINALRQQGFVRLAECVCERHSYKDEFEIAETQVHPPQVPTQLRLVQGYLQDTDLLFISEMMGRGWKDVVRSLGIKDPELDEVEMKFQRQMVEATLEILVRWRDRQGRNVNQLKELKVALNVNERKFTAEKLEEYYQQKQK